jgi:hypothetical protein
MTQAIVVKSSKEASIMRLIATLSLILGLGSTASFAQTFPKRVDTIGFPNTTFIDGTKTKGNPRVPPSVVTSKQRIQHTHGSVYLACRNGHLEDWSRGYDAGPDR